MRRSEGGEWHKLLSEMQHRMQGGQGMRTRNQIAVRNRFIFKKKELHLVKRSGILQSMHSLNIKSTPRRIAPVVFLISMLILR